MDLELLYNSASEIPQGYEALYTERDGKFHFTAIKSMKTQADIDRIQDGLTKERNDHKATKAKLENFNDLNLTVEEVQEKLDRIGELEAAAADKIDEAKLNEMVETRLQTKIAPIQRELDKTKKDLNEKETMIGDFTQKERTRTIHDTVRKAATDQKLLPTAMEDALLLAERVFDVDESGNVITKDNVGVTPGIDPTVWFTDIQKSRPHWWSPSQGGGAGGSGSGVGGFANNPFSADGWNMTEQGKLLRENPEQAKQMAQAAGTTVGGGRPAKK